MKSPEVCVLKADGINCDDEMMHAFGVAGAQPELVHINQLRRGDRQFNDYQILALSGGFSYGDYIASGKALANELTSYLSEPLQTFVDAGKPIIGICNGFQVLVRTGLLPDTKLGEQKITLMENASGQFGCRWIELEAHSSVSKFVQPEDFSEQLLPMQVAHGEGKVFGFAETIDAFSRNRQVVFRYANTTLNHPVEYPDNPNGSMDDIAGLTDQSGLILGMMPHPERSIEAFHPDRRRTPAGKAAGEVIFKNIVAYAKEM